MQRDTIQGLIQAIESISGGLHRRRQIQRQGQQDAEDAQRRLIHDTYAANQEKRAAESHAERMKGDKDGGVDSLTKVLMALGVGSDKEDSPTREYAFQTYLDAGGDPEAALGMAAQSLDSLEKGRKVEEAKRQAAGIVMDPNDPDQRDAEKAYASKLSTNQRAVLAFRALIQDRKMSGNAPAPTQQDMESRAQTMSFLESLNQMAMSRMQRDQQLQAEHQAAAASRQQAAQNKASNYMPTPARVQPKQGQQPFPTQQQPGLFGGSGGGYFR